ncbi:hypothetical protein NEOLEDRAFT_1178276 [Neolentinus lepideus HHB14362 ss-1]|uniref:CBF1-interacting co-repressor CIR N-terminal domain-containing protein n=1 Tax=Neolentinus lepideus HHB14362 ss-1 TaxID=1314782 RepID=A0A165SPS8_9AGAM|nr:hypothetical protein NEOLEDRAFT_1178276 [Neolentinus lepideus HHB14362 ss-1]
MGKLNIAHHKSYHPYRLDNIERVRRDEEDAKLKEEREEDRMRVADAEARMDALRKRAVMSNQTDDEGAMVVAESSSGAGRDEADRLTTARGHINLFADIEQQSITEAIRKVKKTVPSESEKGFPLAPSAKDLKPWYSEKSRDKGKEVDDGRRSRDLARQSRDDPLTFINSRLSSSSGSSSRPQPSFRPSRPQNRERRSPPLPMPHSKSLPPSLQEFRLSRESSERQRALALIARKKREMAGSQTPSTVRGDDRGYYGDLYNKVEVREAYAQRERGRGHKSATDRRW